MLSRFLVPSYAAASLVSAANDGPVIDVRRLFVLNDRSETTHRP